MTVMGNWWGAQMAKPVKILLLAGTSEGAALNRQLSAMEGLHLVTSLAGATKLPARLEGEVVSGGFGGVDGLADFVKTNHINLIVDATHPFAKTISGSAFKVAQAGDIPLMRFVRPAWTAAAGDQWIHVPDIAAAAESLDGWSRPFLAIGRKELGFFADLEDKAFLVRSIEAAEFNPAHSRARFVEARGPFSKADEIALMTAHKTDILIAKNSGGEFAGAKISAARKMRIPVVIIDRPAEAAEDQFSSVDTLVGAVWQKVQAFRLGRNT